MRVGSRQAPDPWLCINASVVLKKQKQKQSKKTVLVKGNIFCGVPLPMSVLWWVKRNVLKINYLHFHFPVFVTFSY